MFTPRLILPAVILLIAPALYAAGPNAIRNPKLSGVVDFSEATNKTALLTQLGAQPAIAADPAGVTKYWSGSKTFELLNNAAVGLGNVPNVDATQRSNHAGTQSADTITDGTANKAYSAAEKTKLAGVAAGATANSADSVLMSRANHTGTQAINSVNGLQTALDAKAPNPSEQTVTNVDVTWGTALVLRQSAALTANRNGTLPAANSLPPGSFHYYIDRNTTANYGRAFFPVGTDTLNGGTAGIIPFIAGGIDGGAAMAVFETDGNTGWRLLNQYPDVIAFRSDTDASARVKPDLSLISPNTTRNFRFPDADSVAVQPYTAPTGEAVVGVSSNGAPFSAVVGSSRLENPYQTLTAGASVTYDVNVSANATLTLGAASNALNMNATSGQSGTLIVKQPAAGGKTLALPGSSRTANGGTLTLTSAGSGQDKLNWTYNGTSYYWDVKPNYVAIAASVPVPTIAWWKFNEGGSSTTFVSENPPSASYNGTATTGWTTYTARNSASTAALDITSATVKAATTGDVPMGALQTLTVTFWIRDTAWDTASKVIFGNGTATNTWRVYIETGTTPKISGRVNGAGSTYATRVTDTPAAAASATDIDAWHHFAIIFDNSTVAGSVRIFKDNVEETTNLSTSTRTTGGQTPFIAGPVIFGNPSVPTSGSSPTVSIDDVRVYEGTLGTTDLAAIYNAGPK